MSNQEWWKTIFNEEYMAIYLPTLNSERTRDDVNFIEEFLELSTPNKIIDIACGFGRHSIELAKRGYEVVGIDYSDYMVKLAKEAKMDFNLKNVIFETGDMRTYKSNKRFDVALLMFTSFGYFDDIENFKTLKNTRRLLKHGGKFLLDLRNYLDVEREAIENGEEIKEAVYRIKKSNVDAKETIVIDTDKRQTITDIEGDRGSSLHFELTHYTKEQITQMLEYSGFSVEKIVGDLKMNSFDEESKRLIIKAIAV